jgi:hypothetical protein
MMKNDRLSLLSVLLLAPSFAVLLDSVRKRSPTLLPNRINPPVSQKLQALMDLRPVQLTSSP